MRASAGFVATATFVGASGFSCCSDRLGFFERCEIGDSGLRLVTAVLIFATAGFARPLCLRC